MADDVAIGVLREIRDEVRSTRTELSERIEAVRTELSEGLSALSERVDRVERRQTETEVRLATELVAVVEAVHEVRDALREDLGLRRTIGDHEVRISAIEKRLG